MARLKSCPFEVRSLAFEVGFLCNEQVCLKYFLGGYAPFVAQGGRESLREYVLKAIHCRHLLSSDDEVYRMSDEVVVVQPAKGLSQVERLVDLFLAPTKTFTDILLNASWWLPYVLSIILGLTLTTAVVQKVGWAQLVDNQVQSSPALQAKLASLKPEALAIVRSQMITTFKVTLFSASLSGLLLMLVVSLVLWGTITFAFGGKTEFKRVFCLVNYAYLPLSLKGLVAALMLYTGVAAENFTLDNMLGTSVGYYFGSPGVLKTFLTSFDIFGLWVVVLMSIGLSIIAGTKRSAGYITVVGWWLVVVLLTTVSKAVFG
jgi:hypothetical protein